MAERWTRTPHSAALSGRRSRDTEPELALRRALHAAGARFRLHRRLGPGCTPDIVLPGRRIAVFVDGDFWHGCPDHYPDRRPAGPNAEMWVAKFRATEERDRRATQFAEELGWSVVRLWECEVLADPAAAAESVLTADRSS